jgi:predicted Ser/Thr protein kinase
MTGKSSFIKAFKPVICQNLSVEGKAMSEQNHLINLYSKEWEEKCKAAVEKCAQLDNMKISKAEKVQRTKQLLKEMILKERRKVARPSKNNSVPVVESKTMRERSKLDFRSQEWTDRCRTIAEKCAQLDNMKISKDEKLRRTKQLLKELVFTNR